MPTHKARILVCQPDEKTKTVKSDGVTVTHSPVSCLNAATTMDFDLIVLCFSIRSIRARTGMVELCRCLKRNALTCKTPVFVTVDRWHRALVEQLKDAGLDFMDVRGPQKRIHPENIFNRITKTGIGMRIDQVMSRLCPFLNYVPLTDHSELIACGAWRNRMVLGGKRLHEVCERANHLHCEYFLNPRPKR